MKGYIRAAAAMCTLGATASSYAQTAQTQPAPQALQAPATPQTQQAPQTSQSPQAPQTPQTPQTPQAPQSPQTPQSPPATTVTSAPVIVSQSGSTVQRDTTSESYRPNRKLLVGGALTLGLSYAPAAIVGSTSDHHGDRNLLIPLAGPWIDLADRGPCGGSGQPSCGDDTGNRVLIAVDGVFQALGALQILGAFVWPEARRVEVVEGKGHLAPTGQRHVAPVAQKQKIEWQVAPAHLGRNGYGFSFAGTF
ncbi:hypothetical protein [Pendulispora albinea]|uniref:Uncharacterized protein n=1 Tax=Pendulispora albinea TaxID=2741071 RepID=A0ABZ2MA79_9BACT